MFTAHQNKVQNSLKEQNNIHSRCFMLGIQLKSIWHADIQKNTAHNQEKNQSTEIDTTMAEITE